MFGRLLGQDRDAVLRLGLQPAETGSRCAQDRVIEQIKRDVGMPTVRRGYGGTSAPVGAFDQGCDRAIGQLHGGHLRIRQAVMTELVEGHGARF